MKRIVLRNVLVALSLLLVGSVAVPTVSAATDRLAPCKVKVAGQNKPKHTTKLEVLHYHTQTQDEATALAGTTREVQAGQNGVRTITYTVSYNKKGKVSKCRHTGTAETTPSVDRIVSLGSYVKPVPVAAPAPAPAPVVTTPAPVPTNCTNGTYVNTAGNTVCRPEASSSAPSGATAQCRDGSYSFSQSRSGTCSHHGGVASWL